MADELIIDGVNTTQALMTCRSKNIKLAEKENSLNSMRVIKLKSNRSISSYVNSDVAAIIKVLGSGTNIDFLKAPDAAARYCKTIADEEDDKDVPRDKNDMPVIIKDLSAQILNDRAMISETSEASFTNKFLMPAITRTFLSGTGSGVIYAI
ncbi:hypothetical protein RMATCC62417_15360 [Rhizopus microsporus]|nr:hypothetical protein RMATCC62417_15360 [Rhizopus microsporus]